MPEADSRISRRYYLTPAQAHARTTAARQLGLTDVQFVQRAIGELVARTGIEWPDDYRDERRRQESDR